MEELLSSQISCRWTLVPDIPPSTLLVGSLLGYWVKGSLRVHSCRWGPDLPHQGVNLRPTHILCWDPCTSGCHFWGACATSRCISLCLGAWKSPSAGQAASLSLLITEQFSGATGWTGAGSHPGAVLKPSPFTRHLFWSFWGQDLGTRHLARPHLQAAVLRAGSVFTKESFAVGFPDLSSSFISFS